jgi:hypothetical protein
VTGPVRRSTDLPLTRDALLGLEKLANAEGFWTMPLRQKCQIRVGGLATEYVRIRSATHDRRVESYGGCNKPFEQLFAVLRAAAALG